MTTPYSDDPTRCPECDPPPATSPEVRCRQCGRSECRHDRTDHASMDYDMHTRTECMTCLTAQNRREDVKRWADLTTADGHDPVAHWQSKPCPACSQPVMPARNEATR